MTDQELWETIKALRARIMGLERENRELKEQNKRYEQTLENMQREIHKAAYEQAKRYKQALEHIQREIHKAIYAPKKQKWKSDFEREFESGKTRGLIQASDIVKEAIEILDGEE